VRALAAISRTRVADWGLAARVLPFVALAVVAKLVLSTLDFEPIEINPLLSGVVAANVFLLGFLLAGTLADFKEAERLPGELASGLESIGDECLSIRLNKGAPSAEACLEHLRDLARGVRGWLEGSRTHDDLLEAVRDLNAYFLALEPATQATFVNRLKGEQAAVRRALVRMEGIRRTSFVTAGYVVAEITAWLVIVALLLTDIQAVGEAAFFLGVITFLLVYMNRLIRDLDNPFEYRRGVRGSADVSLEALERLERRLERLMAADGRAPRGVAEPAA
jgi:hypothetical protein